jgi:hypothetical protein
MRLASWDATRMRRELLAVPADLVGNPRRHFVN